MKELIKINNHSELAKDRLLSQYSDKLTFQKMIDCLENQTQILEDVFYSLLTLTSIEDSFGAQLDNIGDIVGQQRLGLTDIEYRIFIYGRIAGNLSKGTPEELISIYSILTKASNVTFQEIYPAAFSLVTNGTIISGLENEIKDILDLAAAGGVGIVYAGIYEEDPFIISSITNSVSDSDGLGFSSIADVDQGGLAKLI